MKPHHQIILTTIIVGTSLLVGLGGLFSQINGVESRLTARIDRFEDRVDNRFFMLDSQNKEIIERLTRLETLQGVGVE